MSYFGTSDYLLDVAKGKVDGHRMVYVHSYAPAIGTTQEFIWPLGGQLTFNDTPSTLWLTSSNAGDTQVVRVVWLDGSYNEQDDLVVLNGQTPVSIGTGLRVNRAFTVDTTPTAGDIYISNALTHTAGVPTQATTVMMYEAATQTRSMALYTVPAGHTVFGVDGYFSAPKGRDNDFYWNVRNPVLPIPPINTNIVSIYQSTVEIDFAFSPITEKTDAYFTSNTSAGTGRVSIRVPIVLADNTKL